MKRILIAILAACVAAMCIGQPTLSDQLALLARKKAAAGGGVSPIAEWVHTSGVYSDAGSTLLSGSGDNGTAVQEWHDTVSGQVLGQTTTGSKPLYDASLGIQFQGTDDFMALGSALVSGHPFTVFVKIRPSNAAVTGCVVSLVNSGSTSEYFAVFAEGAFTGDPFTFAARNTSAGEHFARTTTGYSASTVHVLAAVANASNSRDVYIDGASIGSNTTAVAPSGINDFAIGMLRDSTPGIAYVGYIQTIRVYDTALDAAAIATISSAL